jgi:hypothetical protein
MQIGPDFAFAVGDFAGAVLMTVRRNRVRFFEAGRSDFSIARKCSEVLRRKEVRIGPNQGRNYGHDIDSSD